MTSLPVDITPETVPAGTRILVRMLGMKNVIEMAIAEWSPRGCARVVYRAAPSEWLTSAQLEACVLVDILEG